jgi:hypothetical protein
MQLRLPAADSLHPPTPLSQKPDIPADARLCFTPIFYNQTKNERTALDIA